ncbi:MAG TPA: hypothetical protein VLE69_02620 [Candidatus Saccharimonadales bacterium]|nr:hypothetical protein [Candidatus Saccharimonadales bacterium]
MSIAKKLVVPGAVLVASFLGVSGGALISALQANAATDTSSTSSTSQSSTSTSQPDPTKGGHVGSNGTKEELLTGDTAEKVKAAALAAVPGGTVQRVETDAEGSPYEAHMTKSDGTQVTVKVDSNFKVTTTENGPSAKTP